MPKYRSKKHKDRYKRYRVFLIIFFSVIFIAIIATLSYFSRKPEQKIQGIAISETHFVDKDQVESEIREIVGKSHLFLFPKDNRFLVPKKKIEQELLENFRQINDVEVEIDDEKRILVNINERKPYAFYCAPDKEEKEIEETEISIDFCWLIDDHGLLFYETNQVDWYMPIKEIKTSEPAEGFSHVVDPAIFKFAHDFESDIFSKGFHVQKIDFSEQPTITLTIENGTKIFLHGQKSLNQMITKFQALFDQGQISLENVSDLEYIDFRFDNNAYLKPREAVDSE